MGRSRTERIDLCQTAGKISHADPHPPSMTSLALKLVMTSLPSPPDDDVGAVVAHDPLAVSLPVRLIDAVSAEENAAGHPG